MKKRRIVFARLGSFSYTNESLYAQLEKRFSGYEVNDFCVKRAMLKHPFAIASALTAEAMTYGPAVFADRGQRHECFFKLPYTFRKTSALVRESFAKEANKIGAVIQTQGLFNARLPDVPLILYLDYSLKSPRFGKLVPPPALIELEAALYRDADAITVTSSHLKKTLIEDYGIPEHKVSVIYIGANVAAPAIEITSDRYVKRQICFVGIEWERKGGPTLVEAFFKVADRFPDARLVIAGCNPPVSHPCISIKGEIPREQVAVIYKESSIFCLPSIIEPFGIAPIEAANYALPVIATRTGGFLDSIDDGVSGILVPPGDADALAAAFVRLLENPAEAMRMGQAGRVHVAKLFDWDVVGAKLADIIRRTANLN